MKNEWSLISFTLLIQMAVGAFLMFGFQIYYEVESILHQSSEKYILAILVTAILAMLFSFLHLGKAKNAYNSLNNIKTSWLSREIIFVVLFIGVVCTIYIFKQSIYYDAVFENYLIVCGLLLGILSLVSMPKLYMLKTIPAWNSFNTYVQFFSSAIILGIIFWVIYLLLVEQQLISNILILFCAVFFILKLISFYLKLNSLKNGGNAGRISFKSIIVNSSLVLQIYNYSSVALLLLFIFIFLFGENNYLLISSFVIVGIISEISSRYLFYASYSRKGV